MTVRGWVIAAALLVWSGAAGAAEMRTVLLQTFTAPSEDGDLAWAATDAAHSVLYAHPDIQVLDLRALAAVAGAGPTDPRDPAAVERLLRLGVDAVVSGRVERSGEGLVVEVRRPGDAAPTWRAQRRLVDAAALSEALRAALPDLPVALGVSEDERVRRFAGRRFLRGEPALRSYGAGARAYFGDGDPVAALPRFRAAAEADPDSTDAWTYVGWSLALQERWREAVEPFAAAAERQPDNFDARWGLQQALDSAGRLGEAARLRAEAPAGHRDVLADRLRRAIASHAQGDAAVVLAALDDRAGTSALRRLEVAQQRLAFATAFDSAARLAALTDADTIARGICGDCPLSVTTAMARAEALRGAGQAAEAAAVERGLRDSLAGGAMPPEVRAGLAGRLAASLSRAEDWPAAAELQALRGDALAQAAGHPTAEAAAAWSRAAAILVNNDLGGQPAALVNARRAHESWLALRGPDDVDAAAAGLVLGRVLYGGRPDQAEPLFRQAAAVMMQRHGADHADTALARYWLARAISAQAGRGAEAEPAWREALDSYRRAHGTRSAATAITLSRYAEYLEAASRPADALPLRAEAADIRMALNGPGHMETAHAYYSLARIERDLQRWPDVEAHARTAAAAYDAVGGEATAQWAARARAFVVSAALAGNRAAEAEALARINLPVFDAAAATDTWRAYGRWQLGIALMRQQRQAEAETVLTAAAAAYDTLGSDSANLAGVLSDLGDVQEDLDHGVEAVAAHRRAVDILTRQDGAASTAVGNETWRLARALAQVGRFQEALAAYRRVQEVLTANGALPPAQRVSLLSSIATQLHAVDRPAEAVDLHRQAVAEAERLGGPFAPVVFWPRERLGWALERQGDLAGAEAVYRQSLVMALASDDRDWLWAAARDLGGVWVRQGRRAGALPLLKMSLNALQEIRAGQGWTPLGRRVQVFETLVAALEADGDGDGARRVGELLETRGAPADGRGWVAFSPAEENWRGRLSELGRAAAPAAAERELAWQALSGAIDDLSRRRAPRDAAL